MSCVTLGQLFYISGTLLYHLEDTDDTELRELSKGNQKADYKSIVTDWRIEK